jgi:hypothetical protein
VAWVGNARLPADRRVLSDPMSGPTYRSSRFTSASRATGSRRDHYVHGVDPEQTVAYLLERLPDYEELLTFPDEAAALLHRAMGDLGRY